MVAPSPVALPLLPPPLALLPPPPPLQAPLPLPLLLVQSSHPALLLVLVLWLPTAHANAWYRASSTAVNSPLRPRVLAHLAVLVVRDSS